MNKKENYLLPEHLDKRPGRRYDKPYTLPEHWHNKPYYSLDAWCKNTYGRKLYKIAIDGGFTCPNRDGTAGFGGCIFCSEGGSGEFTGNIQALRSPDQYGLRPVPCVKEQLQQGRSLFGDKKTGSLYIAYFQAYTNTYGPLSYLEDLYEQALSRPDVAGISIGTRPDCLSEEILCLIDRFRLKYPEKFIWIELGLQSIHDTTAAFIHRGYPYSTFLEAFKALKAHDIPVIVHVILGLPGETKENMLETISAMNHLKPFGIKLQLLHVLKGAALSVLYEQGTFETLTFEEYLSLLTDCISHLDPRITIHRVTGDGPKELLIAPLYSLNKRSLLNGLHLKMRQENLLQGCKYREADS